MDRKASPERVAAERIAKEVYGPYMATVNAEHREVAIEPLERIIREAYAGAAKPTCPKCGDPRLTINWFEHRVKCQGCGEPYPALMGVRDFAQFFRGASPSDDLVKVLTEARDFTETLLTHGDASISIAAKHIWASAERILETLK